MYYNTILIFQNMGVAEPYYFESSPRVVPKFAVTSSVTC